MSDVLYRLEGVRHRLSDAFTLDVPKLEIARGETLCLVGPTGAGKSTLLRLLSLLDPPTAGDLTFDGETWFAPWPLTQVRRIATVPQRPAALAGNVLQNVAIGLRFRGDRIAHAKAAQMLARLRLDGLAQQQVRHLSGGQAQLVALARALAIEPEVLLLDEPTANLDPAHVALAEEAIEEQRARTGATLVWATHNLFQAQRRAARTALLLGGKLVEVAETKAFFENPGDERTRQFVQGKMVY